MSAWLVSLSASNSCVYILYIKIHDANDWSGQVFVYAV